MKIFHNNFTINLMKALLLVAVMLCIIAARQDTTNSTPPKPDTATPRDGCVTSECHVDVKQHNVLHGPIVVNACDACHEVVDVKQHTFKMAREKAALCLFCHEVDLSENMVIHKPVLDGDCMTCHNPHGGTDRNILKAESPRELCNNCHDDVIGVDNQSIHGPVASGSCAACHTPHSSEYPNLLSADGREICFQCHVETRENIENMRVVHGPVNVDCTACHNSHASKHIMMLKEDPETLCESCHESIKHIVDTATTQHAAVTTQRSCMNCHNAHASDYPKILNNDMMQLCFECHDKEIKLDNGKVLGDIKAVIENGNSLHGPISQSNCAACHEIHGGGNFRLLIQEYPPDFYAPFQEEKYALCFSCHDKQLVHDAETTTLTNFRNGDTNLHYLHVNKKKKGRTCRTCHETHASNKDKHIRDSVPFGGWPLPINYEKRENGGYCAPGCHVPYEYVRDEAVVYQPTMEPAIWPNENNDNAVTQPEKNNENSTDK